MPAENRRSRMTRLMMRTALIELMQEKPFRQITIKDLCERADLNRTTFYLHYRDQEDVLEEIGRDTVEKTMAYMENIRPAAETVEYIEAFLRYIRANAVLFRTLFCDRDNEALMASYMDTVRLRLRPRLPAYGPPEQEPYILSFLMHGSIHVIITWIQQGFDRPEAELASLLYRMCDSVSEAVGTAR